MKLILHAIEALRLDTTDYLLKPVNNEDLFSRIDKCFEILKMQIKIKTLEKMVPICCYCRKIRDDTDREHGTGNRVQLEEFLDAYPDSKLSHGICPDCHGGQKKVLEGLKS